MSLMICRRQIRASKGIFQIVLWLTVFLIKIIQFCLKIYDLWIHSPPLGGWMGQWVVSCQISKNRINCDLIEIIQFYLKIYDL